MEIVEVGFLSLWVLLRQLRRERIAERMKALQELVPNANKVFIHLFDFAGGHENGFLGLGISLHFAFVFCW